MLKEIKYKFYADSGHGWLAVPIKHVLAVGALGRISSYSYMRGKTVYLEEDCDAGEFLRAAESHVHAVIVHKYMHGRSPIRSYDRFNYDSAVEKVSQ